MNFSKRSMCAENSESVIEILRLRTLGRRVYNIDRRPLSPLTARGVDHSPAAHP